MLEKVQAADPDTLARRLLALPVVDLRTYAPTNPALQAKYNALANILDTLPNIRVVLLEP